MGKRRVWPDKNNTDKKYWEKVLSFVGLSMRRGESKKLSYGYEYKYLSPTNSHRKPKRPSLSEIEKDRI